MGALWTVAITVGLVGGIMGERMIKERNRKEGLGDTVCGCHLLLSILLSRSVIDFHWDCLINKPDLKSLFEPPMHQILMGEFIV